MKKTITLSVNLLIGVLFISLASYIQAKHDTEIKVAGIRSTKGKIVLNVFKNNTDYDAEKPCKKLAFDKKSMINGAMDISCELEPGTYGFTIVDDENSNDKIDKNFIGVPKEGFGFSNFFMEKMKRPKFDDFKIDLSAQPKIVIRVKYM